MLNKKQREFIKPEKFKLLKLKEINILLKKLNKLHLIKKITLRNKLEKNLSQLIKQIFPTLRENWICPKKLSNSI